MEAVSATVLLSVNGLDGHMLLRSYQCTSGLVLVLVLDSLLNYGVSHIVAHNDSLHLPLSPTLLSASHPSALKFDTVFLQAADKELSHGLNFRSVLDISKVDFYDCGLWVDPV